MANNDKWEMFKNYMHNELGISREDIRTWIEEAVQAEAKRMVNNEFKSFSLKKEVNDVILNSGMWGNGSIRKEIAREAANIISEKLEVKVK